VSCLNFHLFAVFVSIPHFDEPLVGSGDGGRGRIAFVICEVAASCPYVSRSRDRRGTKTDPSTV